MHRDLGCFGRWKPLPLGWATALALRALRIVREPAGEPLRLPRALGSTALRRYLRGKAAAHRLADPVTLVFDDAPHDARNSSNQRRLAVVDVQSSQLCLVENMGFEDAA